MRLCAIYNIWNDWDLLYYSTKNIQGLVDGIIVIYSNLSNYGEKDNSVLGKEFIEQNPQINFINREPSLNNPMNCETDKRNFGLKMAKEFGYTHFIMMDADEFYNPLEFIKAKERFHVEPDLQGLVCATQVYFKIPTLTIGMDTTLVPFIHKITPTLQHSFNRNYPFAWIDGKIKIDPTRSLNINSGVEWSDIVMHHYSWVRKDYAKKIRNSTAKANIERSSIVQDLENAKPGYYCDFYKKILHEVPNYFNIPEYK